MVAGSHLPHNSNTKPSILTGEIIKVSVYPVVQNTAIFASHPPPTRSRRARTPANPLQSSKFVPTDQHADNDVFFKDPVRDDFSNIIVVLSFVVPGSPFKFRAHVRHLNRVNPFWSPKTV